MLFDLYRIVNGPCGCYGAFYSKESADRALEVIKSLHCHCFDDVRIEPVNGYMVSYDREK